MKMSMPWRGRRRFLRVGFAGMLTIATRSLFAAGDATGVRSPLRSARRIVDGLAYPENAAVVGRAYLAKTPHEANAKVLMRMLQQDDAQLRATLRGGNDKVLRALLARRVRRDFRDARVVHVRGWVLSRTEARVYALGALLRG